jgi:hypothetical protein
MNNHIQYSMTAQAEEEMENDGLSNKLVLITIYRD